MERSAEPSSAIPRWLAPQGGELSVELRAGLATWLTMAYILLVNPEILGAAIQVGGEAPRAQLLTATALAAALGSLLMGVLARYPFALAPGMGLNAYFAYTVVIGQGIPWRTALGAVFLSGLVFIALSVTGVRHVIVEAVPRPLKLAVAGGIGLFLAMLGLSQAGLIAAHPATLVALADPTAPAPLLALGGLVVTAALLARRVPGALLIGIGGMSAIAVITGAPVFRGAAFTGFAGGMVQAPAWPTDLAFQLDVSAALGLGVVAVLFTFLFVDFFDTAGTLVGLAERAGFTDSQGRLPRASSAFTADAIATSAGALLGTSTTTTYVESAAGIQEGGRTGLTAVVVAILFLLSLFLWPLAGAVPAAATAPALIVVGAQMMSPLRRIDWEDPAVALPCLLTLALIPLTFSIANGVSAGVIAWVAVHLVAGRPRQVSVLMGALALVLVARYAWLAGQ